MASLSQLAASDYAASMALLQNVPKRGRIVYANHIRIQSVRNRIAEHNANKSKEFALSLTVRGPWAHINRV